MAVLSTILLLIVIKLILILFSHETFHLLTNSRKKYLLKLKKAKNESFHFLDLFKFNLALRRFQVHSFLFSFVLPLSSIYFGYVIMQVTSCPSWIAACFPSYFLSFQPIPDAQYASMVYKGTEKRRDYVKAQKETLKLGNCLVFGLLYVAFGIVYHRENVLNHLNGKEKSFDIVLISNILFLLLSLFMALFIQRTIRKLSLKKIQRAWEPNEVNSDSILYLRSFKDDKISLQAFGNRSSLSSLLCSRIDYEEYLTHCLVNQGYLITMGRPTERLPKPGAYRAYYRADNWKTAVQVAAQRAGCVIVVAGETGALSWEIAQLRVWGVLSKCLFFIPPCSSKNAVRRIHALLSALGAQDGELQKMCSIGIRSIVAFQMRENDTVFCFTSRVKSYSSYFFAGALGTSQIRTTSNQYMMEAKELDDIDLSRSYPRKSFMAPRDVRKVIVLCKSAENLCRKGEYQKALVEYGHIMKSHKKIWSDLDALLYFFFRVYEVAVKGNCVHLKIIGLFERAEKLMESTKWVWTDTFSSIRSEQARLLLLNAIASFYYQNGGSDRATDIMYKMIEISESLGDLEGILQTELDLAYLLRCSKPEEARKLVLKALYYANNSGNTEWKGYATWLLALLEYDAENSGAVDLFVKAASTLSQIGMAREATSMLMSMSKNAQSSGKIDISLRLSEFAQTLNDFCKEFF